MGWRRRDQGFDAISLEIQPALCPVCGKGLYRNVTFLTGGWARCSVCTEVVHYTCLAGGRFLKYRPRICADCKAGRVRQGQKMPLPPEPQRAEAAETVSAGSAAAPTSTKSSS